MMVRFRVRTHLKKLRNWSSIEGEYHDGFKVDRLLFIEAGIAIGGQ
jgi:hypothetical protein